MKTVEFYVEGMHCASCEMLVEQTLGKDNCVKEAKASLKSQKVTVSVDSENSLEELKNAFNKLLEGSGYYVLTERPKAAKINRSELGKAFIISLAFVLSFVGLQKLGIINLASTNQITLPFVFLIGIIASLSTCMAVVGGLVLSLSSSYAKENKQNSIIPLVKFHTARLISFFILGGLIGLLGAAFTLTPLVTFGLNLILFFVMIIMGLNLLDIFPLARKFQLRMPKSLSSSLLSKQTSNYITPIFLGFITFFLPCGFTQSMQLYSLTTGNFVNGAVTMLVFALGTLPILALISVASVKLAKSLQSGLFFKTAGFIVLFFALFNFIGALTAIGLIQPILNI